MKRISVIFLVFFFNASYAQLVIKPKLGLSLAKMKRPEPGTFDPEFHTVNKAGFLFGVAGEYSLNSKISLQIEILYVQKGLKDTSHIPTGFTTRRLL